RSSPRSSSPARSAGKNGSVGEGARCRVLHCYWPVPASVAEHRDRSDPLGAEFDAHWGAYRDGNSVFR
ncbi:MAG: hypothetical protein KJ000_29445, partial [Pirellulaceae bacterium]|nr:hypothetical protein [Pirellulaceae bacterium]